MKLTRLWKGDVFGEYISEKSTLQIQVNEKVTHLGPKGGSRVHWESARGTCRSMWSQQVCEGTSHQKEIRKCFALAFFPKIIISSHISQNDCSAESITLPVTSFMFGFVEDQWWSGEVDPWRDNEPLQQWPPLGIGSDPILVQVVLGAWQRLAL